MPKRKLKPSSLQVNLSDYFGTNLCLKLEFDAFISYLESVHTSIRLVMQESSLHSENSILSIYKDLGDVVASGA